MRVVLETARLALREFEESDVDDLVELDGDPEVTRFINGGRPTARAEVARRLLPGYLAYHRRFPGYGHWAAMPRDGGEFLGWFQLRPADGGPPDEPELGYRLRRSAWGRGFATEGGRALIEHAFTELGACRVFAETMTVNIRSRRVLERCGLRPVRTFHQDWPEHIDGAELGDVRYELDRARWVGETRFHEHGSVG